MDVRIWGNFLQVFDLGESLPDKVLHRLYHNLGMLKDKGDLLAAHIEKNLKLIVSYLSSWDFTYIVYQWEHMIECLLRFHQLSRP